MNSDQPQTTDPVPFDMGAALRNRERQAEDRGMVMGVGLALANLIRTFDRLGMAAEINREFAYDLETYRRAGLLEYDLKELSKAIL